jgi:superfamily II DNA or RNA helicase
LHKIEKILPKIKVLIVDEIHEMMTKTSKKFYNKLSSANVRVAVSATPFKFGGTDKTQKYQVKGYFGPLLKIKTENIEKEGILKTKSLQESGQLSKDKCIFYVIDKPDGLKYDIYLDAVTRGIAQNYHLNKNVSKIATELKGRTLILVERIEHGDTLFNLIPDSFWVRGKDNLETRKFVIKKLQDSKDNVVGIATQKIFNAGIDFKVHNLINAAGGQADHQIIQRFGRGLRNASDKEVLNYFDFMFTINPYLEDHSKKRIKILEKEGHQIEVLEL